MWERLKKAGGTKEWFSKEIKRTRGKIVVTVSGTLLSASFALNYTKNEIQQTITKDLRQTIHSYRDSLILVPLQIGPSDSAIVSASREISQTARELDSLMREWIEEIDKRLNRNPFD